MLTAGVLILAVVLISGNPVSLIGPIIMVVYGILTLVNPMVRYQNNQLEFYNPLGMRLKTWPLESLTVDDSTGKTIIFGEKKNGKVKKILAAPNHTYDNEQSQALIDHVRAEKAFG